MTEDLFPETRISRDALDALQLERLRATLAHAYANQMPYRAKCEAAGVHPSDLKSLADLARFPFTAKSDLRDNYPYGMFAVPRERCVRVHASSGTTGRPTVVGYTAQDIATWSDLMARSIWAGGGRPGDVVHVAYGYGLFTGGLGAHYGAERLGCTAVPMSARARCAPRGRGRATSCTSPMATACSPAGSARTTAPRNSAAPWCRCPAA